MPTFDDNPSHDKYIVFKRDEFVRNVLTRHEGEYTYDHWEIPDAVVIRRQDYFAAPALNAYASCIAIAARLMQHDLVKQQELMAIADYFHQQSELSGEEAWKLPDL